MKRNKITAALFAMCIAGNVTAFIGAQYPHTMRASAETIDSGEFGESFSWELDDSGILKINGSGEILDWSWVNDPKVYGHCRIKDVVVGEGIKKLGYVDYSPYCLENITILDPECVICETPDNADPAESTYISNVRFTGCIYGYSGSFAQTYAEKHKFSFKEIEDTSAFIKGDVNGDGEFGVADVVLLQKWLLAVPDTELAVWKAADICEDGTLDVFDLCLMRKDLSQNLTLQ